MYNMTVMSESQFYSQALPREIERRQTGAKVCSITKAQMEVWIDKKMSADLRNEPMKDYITLRNGKRGWSESYGYVKFTDEVMERIYELYDLTTKREEKERIEKEALERAFHIRSTEVKYAMPNEHIVTQIYDKDQDSVDFLARLIRLGFKLDKDGVWRKMGTWPAKCR